MQLSTRAGILLSLMVLGISAFIYSVGIGGEFLLDDIYSIRDNANLQLTSLSLDTILRAAFSSESGILKRPISMLSFALNIYFWGMTPDSMKLVNIVIHLSNGALLIILCRLIYCSVSSRSDQISARNWIVLLSICAAWLLAPINLSAVLYIVQRMTSLSGTFTLLGIVFYIYGRRSYLLQGNGGWWRVWFTTVIFLCLGLFTKESGALMIPYIAVVEYSLFGFKTDGRIDQRVVKFFSVLLVIPSLFFLYWAGTHFQYEFVRRDFNVIERLLTETRVLLDYIKWILIPRLSDLTFYHDGYSISRGLFSPLSTFFACVFHLVLITSAIKLRKVLPYFCLGILWFYTGHLLTATIFDLELVFEHRNYLPSFGIILAVFSGINYIGRNVLKEIPLALLLTAIVYSYGALTFIRADVWSNNDVFSQVSSVDNKNSLLAQYRYGVVLLSGTPNDDNWIKGESILEYAMTLSDATILPEYALIVGSIRFGKKTKRVWWDSVKTKVSADHFPVSNIHAFSRLNNCAKNIHCAIDVNELYESYQLAFAANPRHRELITIYASFAVHILKDYELAKSLLTRAVELYPSNSVMLINLIGLYFYLGEFDAAQRNVEILKRIDRFGLVLREIKEFESKLKLNADVNIRN